MAGTRATIGWEPWLLPLRAMEMAVATQSVLAARTGMIWAAMLDPAGADHAELGRMAPEKFDAFSKAGAAMAKDFMAMQTTALAQMQAQVAGTLAGRWTPGDFTALSLTAANFANQAAGAPGRALSPVHARVTGNARRLRTRRPHAA